MTIRSSSSVWKTLFPGAHLLVSVGATGQYSVTMMDSTQNIPDGIYYIVLADLVGSTKFGAKWGNGALAARINTFVESAKKALENAKMTSNSGHFLKSVGDGVLIAFTHFPDIVQWNAEFHGKLCLTPPPQERLQTRICVHAGELRFDAGDTLNLATNQVSKMEKQAGAGEVILSDIAYQLALPSLHPMLCEFTEHGSIEVDGYTSPLKLHRLVVKKEWEFLIAKELRARENAALSAPQTQVAQAHDRALAMNIDVSQQGIFILRQLVESGHQKFVYLGGDQWSLQFIDGDHDLIKALDPRFIQDDLDKLVNLQLLSVEYNASGNGIYGITRNAVRFIEAIKGSTLGDHTS